MGLGFGLLLVETAWSNEREKIFGIIGTNTTAYALEIMDLGCLRSLELLLWMKERNTLEPLAK